MLKNYEGVSKAGNNLKDALEKEYNHNDYHSVLHKWYEDEIKGKQEDKDVREEYMSTSMYEVNVIIGNKRKIFINDVKAGNKEQAIKKFIKNIKKEFKDCKYKVEARYKKPDEFMTEDKFNEMIERQVWEENPFDWLSKDELENDERVAEIFGLSGKVESYECDNGDIIEIKDVIGFCGSCNNPINKNMLFLFNDNLEKVECDDKHIGLCNNCDCEIEAYEIIDKEVNMIVSI